MKKMKISGAPMPREEKEIQNSMKFYTYLVCISGLATYPEHTRMFRHKNLVLTQIKQATGITDKTAKQYLYQLEHNGMISYQGNCRYLTGEEQEEILEKIKNEKSEKVRNRKYCELYGAAIWKKRSKTEKDGVYYIPRPNKWTPIPEITLQQLNENFECSELELKLYLLCCSYRDMYVFENKSFKSITFEMVRNSLKIKKSSSEINREIRRALLFLKGIGLLEYTEGQINNLKGGAIPCFKINEVNYYINYTIETVKQEDIVDIDWNEIVERICSFGVESDDQ